MNFDFSFYVPGKITGQGRPRAFRVGNSIRMFDPAESISYKDRIQLLALDAIDKAGLPKELFPVTSFGIIALELRCFYDMPTSITKKRKRLIDDRQIFPRKKPDADNIAKIFMDAMNKVIWKDDAMVNSLSVGKAFSPRKGTEGVSVKVSINIPEEELESEKKG